MLVITKKLGLRLESVDWKNPVVIEYTARDTPKQNSPVEVAFYALANKGHATMHHVICLWKFGTGCSVRFSLQ